MGKDDGKVLIVGAGPAGVASALFLSKKGVKSILIDKETFPRDKICGDGLSGWVISMLYKLDMGLVEEIKNDSRALDSWGIIFYAPNLKSLALPYVFRKRPDEAPGYVIRRKHFDEILINKVKENTLIELIENFKVTEFHNLGNKVEVKSDSGKTLTGSMTIFCDGAKSKFAKAHAGMPKIDKHWATGIKTYYKNLRPRVEQPVPERSRRVNPVEFYFLNGILPGYLWIFPLPNGEANVGLGIRTDIMKKKKINLKSALYQAINDTPELKERFKNAEQTSPIQAWGLPLGTKKEKLSGDRFLLAGDAASLIDPFTGEGVGNALNSGFHAAEHIEECLAADKFDAEFNKKYDKRVYDKLWKELRISAAIQKLLVHPGLFSWVMNKAISNIYLKQSFIKMIDDLDERKRLKNPLFYLRILFSKKD